MKDSIGKFLIIAIVFLLTMLIMLTGCEREEFTQDPECCTSSRIKPNVSPIQQTCCDWDAVNFDPEWNGHNVNQLYFTGSPLCDNELCIYP